MSAIKFQTNQHNVSMTVDTTVFKNCCFTPDPDAPDVANCLLCQERKKRKEERQQRRANRYQQRG